MKQVMLDSWISLAIAIIFGVLGTISLKLTHGSHKSKAIIFLGLFYCISFVALTFAMRYLDLSVVYAVWSGVGTILVSAIGIAYFHESISFRKIFFLLLIVIGVIGIHLSDTIT